MPTNKHGGKRNGAGRKKKRIKNNTFRVTVPSKKLDDLANWYDIKDVRQKVVTFITDLHKQGKPDSFKYNEQFLKETE